MQRPIKTSFGLLVNLIPRIDFFNTEFLGFYLASQCFILNIFVLKFSKGILMVLDASLCHGVSFDWQKLMSKLGAWIYWKNCYDFHVFDQVIWVEACPPYFVLFTYYVVEQVCKQKGHEAGFKGATYIDCPQKPCFLCKQPGKLWLCCMFMPHFNALLQKVPHLLEVVGGMVY